MSWVLESGTYEFYQVFTVLTLSIIAQTCRDSCPYHPLIMETTANPWTKFYERALLELDENKMIERTAMAEAAIVQRLYDIRNDTDHHAERHSIDDAIRTLKFLRSETSA